VQVKFSPSLCYRLGKWSIHAFGVGDDGAIRIKTSNESGWGEHKSSISGSFSSPPTIVANGNGFHCFGIGTDGSVKHKSWGKIVLIRLGQRVLGTVFKSQSLMNPYGYASSFAC
jgi:hypothetical protein